MGLGRTKYADKNAASSLWQLATNLVGNDFNSQEVYSSVSKVFGEEGSISVLHSAGQYLITNEQVGCSLERFGLSV